MRKFTVAAFAALGLMSLPAMAGEDSGFYVGAGIGQSNLSLPGIEIDEGLDYKFDSDDTAFKVFGGWRFFKYLAVELDYMDLGTLTDKTRFDIDSSTSESLKTDLGITAWAPYVVGTLPLGIFELSAKVGYAFYDVDFKISALGEHENDSDSDEDFAWGVGAGVTLFDHLNAKLEYESIEIEEGDLEIYWLTGAWRF